MMLFAMLFSCSSQKKLVENPPFEMRQPTFQKWVGGRAESGQGWKLEIPLGNNDLGETTLEKVFFRGMEAPISLTKNGEQWVASANFNSSGLEKPDIIMHSDSTKEVGNQPPAMGVEMPFQIENDQCLLVYKEGKRLRYVKLENVKEKETKVFQ